MESKCLKRRIDNEQLILLVRKRKELWNKHHEHFFNKLLRQKIWEEIAIEMHNTRGILKSRWKSLRDIFRRELKKIIECQVSGRQYKSEWSHFKTMLFLKDQLALDDLIRRKTKDDDDVNSDNTMNTIMTFLPPTPSMSLRLENELEQLTSNVDKESSKSSHDEVMGFEIREVPDKGEASETHDDDYYFAMSLLPYMRTVSLTRKLSMRMKIIQVVQEENDGIIEDLPLEYKDS